jgi:hypothetical protein
LDPRADEVGLDPCWVPSVGDNFNPDPEGDIHVSTSSPDEISLTMCNNCREGGTNDRIHELAR